MAWLMQYQNDAEDYVLLPQKFVYGPDTIGENQLEYGGNRLKSLLHNAYTICFMLSGLLHFIVYSTYSLVEKILAPVPKVIRMHPASAPLQLKWNLCTNHACSCSWCNAWTSPNTMQLVHGAWFHSKPFFASWFDEKMSYKHACCASVGDLCACVLRGHTLTISAYV